MSQQGNDMNRDDYLYRRPSWSRSRYTPSLSRRRHSGYDLLAAAAEEQRLLSLRQRGGYRNTTAPQPTTASASMLYDDGVSLEDLQLAMHLSSSPRRPDPFGQHSVLPYGPSRFSGLPNASLAPPIMPIQRLSTTSSTSKRKRESSPRIPYDSKHEYEEEDETKKPAARRTLGNDHETRTRLQHSSFPLPSLKEASSKTIKIPLFCYLKLWETTKGELFRKRIHCNQVPIIKDTSITGQYSMGRRMMS